MSKTFTITEKEINVIRKFSIYLNNHFNIEEIDDDTIYSIEEYIENDLLIIENFLSELDIRGN